MAVNKEYIQYCIIRAFTSPFGWMPYSFIRKIANILGILCFYCMRDFRKRTLSNLALATDLHLSQKELIAIAKKSFQNLVINCLEYPRLAKETDFSRILFCKNPEVAMNVYNQGKGIIFFCGHQANWEILFLDGTLRMKGIAIGKPIKNNYLYRWIISIREKNGGKIIHPRNAVLEGLRALKKGSFIGIVGDQGMPDSGYSFPFFGRRAWTSTAPALLGYKTGCPIIFASTQRTSKGYEIHYADPIWPDLTKPLDEAIPLMMDQALHLMQKSIAQNPGEWLWQHNRWKQQTPKVLYKRFRQDCICIILPEEKEKLQELLPHLATLKAIYENTFFSIMLPSDHQTPLPIQVDEIIPYKDLKETLTKDFRFKLIFNFANYPPLYRHFQRLSAFEVLDLNILKELAKEHLKEEELHDFSQIFKKSLCRPGSI